MRGRALAAGLWLPALSACALLPGRPAWELPPPPVRDAPVVDAESLTRAELDNGLRVLVLEDHRLPRVTLGVTCRRGEGSVAPERAGLAAFTAELMKRGAGSRDALALAEAVDALGASLAVSADFDETRVRVSGLSSDLDALMDILADVTLRPRFEPAEARKARGEQLAGLEQAKDDPATLAAWYSVRALYAGHRYGLPGRGTPESVAGLDARAARAFHAGVFVPGGAVFSASGDVATAELLPLVGEAFGSWPPAELAAQTPPPPDPTPTERRVLVVDRPDLGQARIRLSHEGIARTDPERIAASLMNTVIGGGGFSSRLMTRVRADAGLTYGVWSGFDMRRRPGPFAVSTFTRVAEARRVIDLVLEELERARVDPPSEAELRSARSLAVGSFALGLETSGAVMEALVDLDVYGLPEDSLDTYRARVLATGSEETARLARERLHPERASIVLVGPAESLVPQLEGLGPVEVVRP